MNDEELIERLRRTLHERAEALRPSPGHVPEVEQGGGAGGPVGLGPGGLGGAGFGTGGFEANNGSVNGASANGGLARLGGDGADDLPLERQTAEYVLSPPTGPVPITGRRNRRRSTFVAGGALIAAAAAVVVGIVLSTTGHPVQVPASRQGAPATTVAPVPTTVAPQTVPITAPPQPTTTVAPASPVVPAGFLPVSVTFVSPYDGWALGHSPNTPGCVVIARTTDAGNTWYPLETPPVADGCSLTDFSGALQMRFADPEDGWIYTSLGQTLGAIQGPSQLWSTHDGGRTWAQVNVPVAGQTIADLEAAGAQVNMVVYGPCQAGTTGCRGQVQEEVLSSPVSSDHWVPASVQPSVGAGPVLDPQMTLWGNNGWLVNNNRTVVSGARLTPSSGWADWTPPCSAGHGMGQLAASSATDLYAVCAEGAWGTPDTGTVAGHNWLFHSTDGGQSFTAVGQVPGDDPMSFTVAPGNDQTMVLADGDLGGLRASFDGGRTWTAVVPGLTTGSPPTSASGGSDSGAGVFTYVGFTTSTQGVAIRSKYGQTLFMTRDGGHTWSPVQF